MTTLVRRASEAENNDRDQDAPKSSNLDNPTTKEKE
jgi:hypothetical protein